MPARFEASVRIQAPRDRVWRALTVPSEVVAWDTGLEAPLYVTAPYPRPGQHARWRYRVGRLRLTLHDEPLEVDRERRLRSHIRIGPLHVDETYSLEEEGDADTMLTVTVGVWVALPLMGPLADGLLAGRLARCTVSASLAAIKAHCEAG